MLGVVINFCSADINFLPACLAGVSEAAEEISLVYTDHLFAGIKEDTEALDSLSKKYATSNTKTYKVEWKPGYPSHYWHNMSRQVGANGLSDEISYVLFLDVDEIADPALFKTWVEGKTYKNFDSMKLANYWYFRDPTNQANTLEDSPVLIRKDLIQINLDNHGERQQFFEGLSASKKISMVKDRDDKVMFHHFSWVRSKEQLLTKVRNWGHSGDRNWTELVEKEFCEEFSGKDFVHGYSFKKVANSFNITI